MSWKQGGGPLKAGAVGRCCYELRTRASATRKLGSGALVSACACYTGFLSTGQELTFSEDLHLFGMNFIGAHLRNDRDMSARVIQIGF